MAAALKFTVRRRPAVVVAPAAPTPRELKRLSDIDDIDTLRGHVWVIQFYRRKELMSGGMDDPAMIIRDAVAKVLVHYYPMAGRLKELEGRKLAVDCTGEGVLFVEADADVRLEQFGSEKMLLPPFPCIEELTSSDDVPDSSAILNSPLLLFQVTRLACGGFILAARLNHTMMDAQGLTQFLAAAAEMARGLPAPTIRPVWQRELLLARDPPQPSFPHHEFDDVPDADSITMPLDQMACHTFHFGPKEVAALRAHLKLAPHLHKNATRFDLVIGSIWKCRTEALSPDPDQEMRVAFAVDARGRCKETEIGGGGGGIPSGYYGNAFAYSVATSTARELRANPLSYAVELVKKAKDEVDMEYMRSMADATVLQNRAGVRLKSTCMYCVSDAVRAKHTDLDFGWGNPVYGGPANAAGVVWFPWLSSYLFPFKSTSGEDGVALPMYLPDSAMGKAVEEMDKLLNAQANNHDALQKTNMMVRSAL